MQNKLGDYQAPVDPAVWSAVQSGIGAASSGAAAAGGGILIKAVVGLVAAAVISVGVYIKVNSGNGIQPEAVQVQIQELHDAEELQEELTLTENKQPEVEEVIKEPRIQRSTFPTEEEELKETESTPIAKVEEQQTTTLGQKQVPLDVETNETKVSEDEPRASHNINRGHNEANHSNQAVEPQELSASFYGLQDEYDAMHFELIPEQEDAHAYSWELDGQYFSEPNLSYTFDEPGVYSVVLTVTGKTGKLEKQTLELQVFEPPVFKAPNVFSPNNDDKNPILDFEAMSKGISIVETQIFSTSGELIYTSDEYSQKWDGSYSNGEPCPQGQYIWKVIYISDSHQEYKEQGTVAIIR